MAARRSPAAAEFIGDLGPTPYPITQRIHTKEGRRTPEATPTSFELPQDAVRDSKTRSEALQANRDRFVASDLPAISTSPRWTSRRPLVLRASGKV